MNYDLFQRVKDVIDGMPQLYNPDISLINRLSDVMRSQEGPNPVILFIDELHLITVGKNPGGQSSGM